MEDKIVGPLTLVAFSELIVSLMIAYTTWRYGNTFLFVLVGVPAILFGLAFAFVRPYEQPFSRFAYATLQFLTRPKLRAWKKDPALERLAVPAAVNPVHQEREQASLAEQVARRERTVSQLDQLSRLLDTQGEAAVAASGGVSGANIDTTIEGAKPKPIAVQAAAES